MCLCSMYVLILYMTSVVVVANYKQQFQFDSACLLSLLPNTCVQLHTQTYPCTTACCARLADPSPICQLEPVIKYVSLFLFPSEFFFCPTHGWVNKQDWNSSIIKKITSISPCGKQKTLIRLHYFETRIVMSSLC